MKKFKNIMSQDESIKGEIVEQSTNLEKQYKLDEDNAIIFEPLVPEKILLKKTIPQLIIIATKTKKTVKFKHYGEWVYITSESTFQEVKDLCDKIFHKMIKTII